MKRKKPASKSISPECPGCGLAPEAEGKFCHSCAVIHDELVDIALKRSVMIRYARMHFYDAICIYRLWLLDNRRKRLFQRVNVIADWLDRNKRNKAEKKGYEELHLLFLEFLSVRLVSLGEKKLEEMFKVLERR